MSSSSNSSLPFIAQQITIYGGITTLVFGIIGDLLTLIVFLSLETFRQSSCAFYLTIMSFVNIGQLFFGLFSRILIAGFTIDWTISSIAYCKFRLTCLQLCASTSYACLCLATIDQYFATCTRVRWQQWSNIKLAHRLIILYIIVLIIFLIPYPIFLDHVKLASGIISCNMNNVIMLQYRNYFMTLFILGYIPDLITVVFGILAHRNVQQIAYRTVPLVRRELDKQLTTMVLVQVVINVFTNIPFVTTVAVMYATANITNPALTNIIQFIYSIALIIFYTYFAVRRV
jgi:hypothetical protein